MAGSEQDGRRRWPALRLSIGAKLCALVGALVVVLMVASGLLLAQLNSTSSTYDRLLRTQVAQALQARRMQVEFKVQVQDWKDVLLRGFDAADLTTYLAQFRAQDQLVQQINKSMIDSTDDASLRAALQRFSAAHAALDTDYARALAAFRASNGTDPTAADRMVRGLDRPPTAQLDTIVANLQSSVSSAVSRQASENSRRIRALVIGGTGILLVVVGALVLAVMSIVRPIRRLTREALSAANDRLPEAISAIGRLDPDDDPPPLPPFTSSTSGELTDLASALTQMQSSALRLAADQHRAERETADMLVSLGRRNQNLLGRMLAQVTAMEQRELDPEVMSQLFALDHVTTRVRRNAESMLVLAGAVQTRTWSRAVPVVDVVRAALSEIEDYARVDLHHVEDGLVAGAAVADVVHLLAELVENATHFSPPTTQVAVVGQSVREGYRLRVVDQGVGMTRQELAEANGRIHRSDAGWSSVRLLGLHVVGRLARRRGIQVTLEPSAGRGITASVLLPLAALGGRDLEDTEQTERPVTLSAPPDDRHDPELVIDLTDRTAPPGSGPVCLPPVPPVPLPPAPQLSPAPQLAAASQPPPGPQIPPVVITPAPVFAAPAGPTVAAASHSSSVGAMPRRVRGAQLPDLGPVDDTAVARPQDGPGAPESLRWQLRSFQLDVQAARRARPGGLTERNDRTDHDGESER